MNILVIIEQRRGDLKRPSLEVLGEARRMADNHGDQVVGLLLGNGIGGLAEKIQGAGSHRLLVGDNPVYDEATPADIAREAVRVIDEHQIGAVFLAATVFGRELSAHLAIDKDTGVATDCVTVERLDDGFRVVRPVFAGKALLTLELKHPPYILTFRR